MSSDRAPSPGSPEGAVAAEALRERLGWDRKEIAAFLGVSSRAYAYRVRSARFQTGEKLKLEMLSVVFERASDVFQSEKTASDWLRESIMALDLQAPIDHLSSIHGYERVKATLAQIEYGLY